MNLTEIKNADRNDLIEYLTAYDVDFDLGESTRSLRNKAKELYWQCNENGGFTYENISAALYQE